MPQTWRAATAAISLWLAIVASTSTVAWLVIDRAGREVVGTDVAGPSSPGTSPGTSDVLALVTPTPTPTPRTTTPARPPAKATPSARPSTPAQPSPTADPSSSGGTPQPATSTPRKPAPQPQPQPASVTGSRTFAQGTVGVSCRGSVISLRSVRPEDGWSFEIGRTPSRITVTFHEGEGDTQYTAHAFCQNGSPAFGGTTGNGGGGEGGDNGGWGGGEG